VLVFGNEGFHVTVLCELFGWGVVGTRETRWCGKWGAMVEA